MKTDDIRQAYLAFFTERDHKLVPSSTLIPRDDPTLLFTSAGMVQFKPYYTGEIDPLPYTRAVSCQKCFRAGGKASDLENVGKTLRHHTFFEMLGNFSFGDYFKREACAWALEFTRDVMKLDMDRVWVSYFEEDEESAEIWDKELGFPRDRIVPMGAADNFWGPAGETGACGPCSEMHYDRGEEHGPNDKLGDDTDRFLEYWNMVFPQFDQQPDGSRPQLKNRGIDTGLGLARMALIKQDTLSNYTIDAMWPITSAVAETVGIDYMQAEFEKQMSVNVIADHIRALTFVMSEGLAIGNTDRSYVLKRILRRAARYGRRLGMDAPFIYSLVPIVVDTMGAIYPEIKERPDFVQDSIRADEENFHRTISSGLELLDKEIADLKQSGEETFPGEVAFRLWETYGFPKEDTMESIEDAGLKLDDEGFSKAADFHRSASIGGGGISSVTIALEADFEKQLNANFKPTEFLGYDELESGSEILAIVKDFEFLGAADQNVGNVTIVLDESPFYAESGGQVGDIGTITTATGHITIIGCKKTKNGIFLHEGKITEGHIKTGQDAKAEVDGGSRSATERNHSATHLMQGALKRVLGDHVTQSGSLVNPDGLRFDFTHLKALTDDELRRIEEAVNAQVRANAPVEIEWYSAAEATKVPGVIAPFDEKYGDKVRVVSMGETVVGDDEELSHWDVEFCGGTHVKQTGEIGTFVIRSESSISQGVRRIEALTGAGSLAYLLEARDTVRQLSQSLSVEAGQIAPSIDKIQRERRDLEKQVMDLRQKAALAGSGGGTGGGSPQAEELPGGIKLIAKRLDGLEPKELRPVSAELTKNSKEKTAVVLLSESDGKVALSVAVSDDLTKSHPAGNIIKEMAAEVGGSGGGRPDFAQAGGKDPSGIDAALAKARELFSE